MTGLRVCALVAVAVALAAAVACEPWDPEPRMQSFALVNAHEDVSCEGCHPYEPPFTAEVGTCVGLGFVPLADPLAGCLACHECDRPDEAGEAISIPHYPGVSCGTSGCHALLNPLWAPDGGGTGTGVSCDNGCHLIPPVTAVRSDAAPSDASHAGHLDGTTLRTNPLVCDDCHPAGGFDAPTHDDDTVDVVMEAPLARLDGALPAYVAGTCSGTYCHGATMTFPVADPIWNDPAFDAASCGPCHGWPPASHFTDNCFACHGPTVSGDLPALADKTTHLDGCVQAQGDLEYPSGTTPCP